MFSPKKPKLIQGREALEDEYCTAAAWNRPPRKYYTDTPYYPWAPKTPPKFRVSFKLGWQ